MAIRDAQSSDFDAIAAITNHYIRNTPIHFATEPVTGAALREVWEKHRAVYPFLVLEGSDSRVAGFARAYRWRERAAYDRTAEVGIYLAPELCGRGLGRPLYAALIEACRRHRFHSLVGGIALPNEPSVRLHEALGFVHAGTVKQAGWKFDQWHDVGFWQLMLE